VRRNKTDRTDTEALLEANRCGGLQPVPVKTLERQTLQALHRVRTQWQTARTARINVLRNLLREQGLSVPVGGRTVVARVSAIVADAAVALPDLLRLALSLLIDEVRTLEAWVAEIDQHLGRVAAATSPAGSASRRASRPRAVDGYLGSISKRGDRYLRCLLTHGARAVLLAAQRTARVRPHRVTRLQQWAVALAARRGHNHRRDIQRGPRSWRDRSDRHRARPTTPLTLEGPVQRLALRARMPMMARSDDASQQAGYTTASDFDQCDDRHFLADIREESIYRLLDAGAPRGLS